jgi:hypothetical protein
MHEQPNCAYDTVLPIKPGDNGYALHFLVVIFYEADMPFEGRDVFPTRKIRGINQQSDFALLLDETHEVISESSLLIHRLLLCV